jgi:hypothetical protein
MNKNQFLVRTSDEVFAIANGHNKHVTLLLVQEIEQVLKNGYGYLNLSSSLDEVVKITSTQFQPLIQDKEVHDLFSFREKGAWEDDLGLIRRKGGEDDKKHFFHFKPEFKSVIDELLSNPTFDSPYKKHEQFFRSAHVVFFTVNMLAEQVVRIMDLFCDSDLLQSIRAYNKSSLRLLSYDPYCEVQAAQHTDKSLFTFQLWADVRGLVLYDYNREPIYHEHIPGKLMMFLGRKMEKKFEDVRNDERPLAIPHEVCVSDEDKSKQRNSAVFFVHDQTDIVNFQPSLLKVVKPV